MIKTKKDDAIRSVKGVYTQVVIITYSNMQQPKRGTHQDNGRRFGGVGAALSKSQGEPKSVALCCFQRNMYCPGIYKQDLSMWHIVENFLLSPLARSQLEHVAGCRSSEVMQPLLSVQGRMVQNHNPKELGNWNCLLKGKEQRGTTVASNA